MEELNSRAEMEMRKAGEELMRKAAAKKKAEAKGKEIWVDPITGHIHGIEFKFSGLSKNEDIYL